MSFAPKIHFSPPVSTIFLTPPWTQRNTSPFVSVVPCKVAEINWKTILGSYQEGQSNIQWGLTGTAPYFLTVKNASSWRELLWCWNIFCLFGFLSFLCLALGIIEQTDLGDSICLCPCQCNTLLINAEGDYTLIPEDRMLFFLWLHEARPPTKTTERDGHRGRGRRIKDALKRDWMQALSLTWYHFAVAACSVIFIPAWVSSTSCSNLQQPCDEWWVFLISAASADWIILYTCFQGWASSFCPGRVTLSICKLAVWHHSWGCPGHFADLTLQENTSKYIQFCQSWSWRTNVKQH